LCQCQQALPQIFVTICASASKTVHGRSIVLTKMVQLISVSQCDHSQSLYDIHTVLTNTSLTGFINMLHHSHVHIK